MKTFLLLFLLFLNYLFAHNENLHTKNFEPIIDLTAEEKEFIKLHPFINVGVESNWPPFDFIENGKYQGMAKDYLTLIEKKSGLKFNYISGYSWNELLELTKNKKIDLLPALAKNEQREKFLKFTQNSYLSARDYVFTTSKDFKNFEDLKDKKVAIPKGFIQVSYMQKNYPDVKIVLVNDILEAIDYTVTNKADAFISNLALVGYLTKKHSILDVKPQFVLDHNQPLHMATRDDYDLLISIINKALDSILVSEKNLISLKWITNQDKLNDIIFTKKEKDFISNHPRLKVANELDWVPYDYFEDGKPKGYVIDYMKLLFSKIEIEPEFVTDSWSNLYKDFQKDKIDILPVLSYKETRKEILNYSNPYIFNKLTVITRKNNNDIINIDDLAGKRLAVVKGWASSEKIKKNYSEINVIEFNTLAETFEAVKSNLVDATIHNEFLANYHINKNYSNDLKTAFFTNVKGYNNNLYIGLTKRHPELKTIIDKAMSMISPEELNNLKKKWLTIKNKISFTNKELEFIDNTVINVGYTDNWAPFSFSENGKAYGLGFDIWKYIVDNSNLKVNIEFKNNFTQALDDLKNKDTDILITTSKTKDREKYSIFSEVYYKAPIGIATLHDKNYIPDITDIFDKKIGVGKNYTTHKLLAKKYPNMKFVFVDNIKDGLEKLSNNEIYALVDNMPVLAHNIKKYAYSNIKITGSTGISFDLQMMIRDDYNELQSIINKVLSTLTPSDKKEIFDKWAKIEYEQEFDIKKFLQYLLPLVFVIIYILYKNRQLLRYQKSLKKTQVKLENNFKNFKTLVNLTIEAIIIVKDEKILFSNDITSKMFALDKKHLKEYSINNLFENKHIMIKDIIVENSSSTFELIALRNKEKFPVLVKSKDIIFQDKECTILSIIDLSEIKEKENLLVQQSKMASLGEMIANIAHQWRQPLSFISTAATGMKLQKEFGQLDDKLFNKTIDDISQTTNFLSQTIDDFQNYLKSDKKKSVFTIKDSMDKVLNIVNSSFSNNFIDLQLNIKDDVSLNSYENELNQAVLNILNNSKDSLKEIDIEDKFIIIDIYKKAQDLHIVVTDNGGGVDMDIINKVFDPYFTTKHKSQGTGLGLYMTHKIINDSLGGQITISNTKYTHKDKLFDSCAKVEIILPLS